MHPNPSAKLYPVHEVFHTFQGEGTHMGRAAFFIRLFGCPVKCSFCDSAGTWHPDYVPKDIKRHSVAELVRMAEETRAGFVVITGGEPTIHDLGPLLMALSDAGIGAAIETCGGFNTPDLVKVGFAWMTLSPKRNKLPTKEALAHFSELKIIVDHTDAIEEWMATLAGIAGTSFVELAIGKPVWLHPQWSQRGEANILNAIANEVKLYPGLFRAGWQMHKNYQVDALDSRSRPLVPLGGNPDQGL